MNHSEKFRVIIGLTSAMLFVLVLLNIFFIHNNMLTNILSLIIIILNTFNYFFFWRKEK
ncbi:hypothetical protein [Holzapfeliella floricola]|uniref:hypothetical protein n=1 Tax=Holzapfeliella floricola TaxID=679249 RepID=UPI000AF10A59|nr:hypothetical protein [Holzapfeliella floricola]